MDKEEGKLKLCIKYASRQQSWETPAYSPVTAVSCGLLPFLFFLVSSASLLVRLPFPQGTALWSFVTPLPSPAPPEDLGSPFPFQWLHCNTYPWSWDTRLPRASRGIDRGSAACYPWELVLWRLLAPFSLLTSPSFTSAIIAYSHEPSKSKHWFSKVLWL